MELSTLNPLILLLLAFCVNGCTEKFMDLSLVNYRAKHGHVGNPLRLGLRILQEYQFNCSSTNITSLILGIDVRIVTNSRTLFPSVQVYRPTVNIVNQYDLVTGSERTIYYSTSNVSTSGVFEYPLNPPIPVMSGDLLAVSQPEQANSIVRVYYIKKISFASSRTKPIRSKTVDLSSLQVTDQLILVYPVTDGYCVNSINSISASVIREHAPSIHGVQLLGRSKQLLYPEIAFSCNGSLTKWTYGGTTQTSGLNLKQPELQIWRQLGPNNYIKIRFSSVNASTMIGTNLYEFIPQTPLEFQEGDIFGLYATGHTKARLILYEQIKTGPLNMYILSNAPLSEISTALTTAPGNDFPLVTVEISPSNYIPSFTASATSFTTISVSAKYSVATLVSVMYTNDVIQHLVIPVSVSVGIFIIIVIAAFIALLISCYFIVTMRRKLARTAIKQSSSEDLKSEMMIIAESNLSYMSNVRRTDAAEQFYSTVSDKDEEMANEESPLSASSVLDNTDEHIYTDIGSLITQSKANTSTSNIAYGAVTKDCTDIESDYI